jgi:hypothetical protein
MDVHLPQELLEQADEPSLSHLTSDDASDADAEDMTSLFRCLRQSVLAKKHGGLGGPVPARRLHNIADVYILRRVEGEPETPEGYRFRALCLAAHVFLYAGLRLVHRNAPLVRVMVGRLREALDNREAMAIAAWPSSRLRDLLWVLFVGSVVADAHGHGAWFDVRLKTVIRMIGCRSRAEVEELLRRYVWNDEYGRQVLDRAWSSLVDPKGGIEGHGRTLLCVDTHHEGGEESS